MIRVILAFAIVSASLVTALLIADEPAKVSTPGARSLFDGKTAGDWKPADFAGGGEIKVQDGALVIRAGKPMAGVVWKGKELPKVNYEVTFDAQRISGSDFFVGFTFPIKESPCTLIIGGWGGGLTGFSSIDGSDASENETTGFLAVESGKWYQVRMRVTEQRVDAWVDGKFIAGFDHRDKKVDVRLEVEANRPYGFATYSTAAGFKNIKLRDLTPEEIRQGVADAEKALKEKA